MERKTEMEQENGGGGCGARNRKKLGFKKDKIK